MLGAYNWKISRGNEAENRLQGYVIPQYAKPASKISFYASSELDSCEFMIRIYRLGWYNGAGARQVHFSEVLNAGNHGVWSKNSGWVPKVVNGNAQEGMNWPKVYELYIPEGWLSGSYIARFETLEGKAYIHPFWVSTSEKNNAKIAVLGSVISSQAKNWWGGFSATKVIDGKPELYDDLYFPVGSKKLSFKRPYFNPRGGDSLRWEYPLVRWLEKNKLDVAYHTDLELETNHDLLTKYDYVITAGPMRYWTENTELALKNFVHSGGNLVHLGAEAGQHLVALKEHKGYNDGQIILQPDEEYTDIGERLRNEFFSSEHSGSRNKAPWPDLKFSKRGLKKIHHNQIQNYRFEGIVGPSWDKAILHENVEIISNSRVKHKRYNYRKVNSTLKNFPSGGTIFNAGIAGWTWGLEEFGNHGNAMVNEELQRITLALIGKELQKESEISIQDLYEQTNEISIKEFNEILRENPRDFDALIGAGIKLWELENYEQAHSYLETALKVDPNSSLAMYRIARNYHKLGMYEKMIPFYEKLLHRHPNNTTYHLQYGTLLVNLERFEEAEDIIKKYAEFHPDPIKPLLLLAHCCRRGKKLTKAEEYCQRALAIEPENLLSLIEFARIGKERGDYFLASERWKPVLEKDPNNYSGLIGTARANLKEGDFKGAKILLEKLVNSEKHKHRIWPYVELINMLLYNEQNYEATIKTAKAMIKNVGKDIQNHKDLEHIGVCNLSLCLSKLNKYDECIELLSKYLFENPDNAEYRLALYQVYKEIGEHKKAFEYFVGMYDYIDPKLSNFQSTGEKNEISVDHLERTSGEDVENGPLVSVIMTAYKSTECIDVAVKSILEQTYRNIELIIVDDNSPDNTFEYIEELSKHDSRIKPIKLDKNGGTYVAKNHGMNYANGDYIAFHDSDDWCHPQKIKIQVKMLEDDSSLMGITTSYIRVDENSNVIYRGKGSIRHACISLMIRKEKVKDKIGYFDSVRVSADSEYERRIKAFFGNESIEHLQLPLIVASVRSESLSGGGKFAMDWTGLSGPRLNYRKQFEAYHEKIRAKEIDPYVPFPLEERTFDAPEEMIW